jgi:2-polyprenyl-6-methoxyphenol hydroxylase-like FAD-dependent oxidoreductase
MEQSDVLIAGAGPTGLVLALWLTKAGTKVRIIDKAAGPGTTSRALAVQARTLELYRQLDLTDAVIARGHRVPGANFWIGGERKAHISLDGIGKGATPYPFLHIFPQDEHEKLLIERLEASGVRVERQTELLGFRETEEGVIAQLRGPDGGEQDHRARYLAGCDGARSKVRETIGTGFPGGTYQHLFYVADVEAEGPALNGELNLDLDTADFVAIFPLAGEGRARLIGTVRDARADRAETLTFDDVSSEAIRQMKVSVRKVNWFSTYHVHHRVTQHFRKGRAFLAGDAAHIHSPVGGQGMNTGIGDAINLAWKLAAVVAGRAPEALLDSYEAERIGFAHRLVASTDRAFTFVTSEGRLAAFVRTYLASIVIPTAFKFEAVRKFAFRTVSQTAINYRGSGLSRGSAGSVQGGDRLPWVQADGSDNFAPLAAVGWQVHVYGAATPALTAWCEQQRVPLHIFAWRAEHEAGGLARDALYLLRPDTYVALAEPTGAAVALERYFGDQGIRPAP